MTDAGWQQWYNANKHIPSQVICKHIKITIWIKIFNKLFRKRSLSKLSTSFLSRLTLLYKHIQYCRFE